MKTATSFKTAAGLAAAIVLVIGALALLREPAPTPPPELRNTLYPEARELDSFELVGSDGERFGPEGLQGEWTLLFFGYTHCPDVCPTTLLTLQHMRRGLAAHPEAAQQMRYLFVSVDPKRDTPEHLAAYLRYFDPAFVGATGERADIDRLVDATGAVYMFEGDTSGDDYIVNHSATLYLVAPDGRLFARLTPPHEPEAMVDTLLKVRAWYDRVAAR